MAGKESNTLLWWFSCDGFRERSNLASTSGPRLYRANKITGSPLHAYENKRTCKWNLNDCWCICSNLQLSGPPTLLCSTKSMDHGLQSLCVQTTGWLGRWVRTWSSVCWFECFVDFLTSKTHTHAHIHVINYEHYLQHLMEMVCGSVCDTFF